MIDKIQNILQNEFGNAIIVAAIILLTISLERIIRGVLRKAMKKSIRRMKVDHTQFTILRRIISVLIYLIGFGVAISFIPPLRALSVSLFAGAGVFAVIIGFAAQKPFANLVSGVFIAIFKPFRVGDRIKFSENMGVVEDITLRHTIVKNFENKRFVVPNAIISDEIIENYNLGDEKTCKFVEFNVSYDSNIDKAMKIMQQAAEKHPHCIDNRTNEELELKKPIVKVKLIRFTDSGVRLRAWVWAKDPLSARSLGFDLNKQIMDRFNKVGIEIPYPHRTIVYKNKKKHR